ncbi:MAG: hypothetical protein AB3N12_04555 [Ruegeria sp.]
MAFDDLSDAIWDSEDGRYFGVETGWAEVDDLVSVKIFVDLQKENGEFELSDFQFLTQDLVIRDYFEHEY